MQPKWSILIATVGERADRFQRLLDALMPQVRKHQGRIEVVAYWNNFERPLGEIRQALVEDAKGEYISFIDDDDMVPEYYCDKVMDALKLDVDYVGWQMQLFNNGERAKPTYHSLSYPTWSEDELGYYRNISHLNPIKKSLALKESFIVQPGLPEDFSWAHRMTEHVCTESYINQEMYFYLHSPDDSIWRGGEVKELNLPKRRLKYFRYHPRCLNG